MEVSFPVTQNFLAMRAVNCGHPKQIVFFASILIFTLSLEPKEIRSCLKIGHLDRKWDLSCSKILVLFLFYWIMTINSQNSNQRSLALVGIGIGMLLFPLQNPSKLMKKKCTNYTLRICMKISYYNYLIIIVPSPLTSFGTCCFNLTFPLCKNNPESYYLFSLPISCYKKFQYNIRSFSKKKSSREKKHLYILESNRLTTCHRTKKIITWCGI